MRGTAKSESEQKMKMVWGRVLLLAATVAGLEVAIEDYFGDVTFLQGEHSKKKYDCYSSYGITCQTWPDPHYHDITDIISGKKQTVVCTVEDPDPVGAIRWRIGDRLTLDQHLNLVQIEKNYSINGYVYSISRYQNMFKCPFS